RTCEQLPSCKGQWLRWRWRHGRYRRHPGTVQQGGS
ncbi:hypothetical protein BN1723_019185, partial [Verticillium longisporum]